MRVEHSLLSSMIQKLHLHRVSHPVKTGAPDLLDGFAGVPERHFEAGD